MKRSSERILTSHTGSLARPTALIAALEAAPRDPNTEQLLRQAVADIVRRQAETGLDVVSDGEMSKQSFITYVNERLSGFEPDPNQARSPWADSRETASFPEFYERSTRGAPNAMALHMVCTGPITYRGHDLLRRDIANLKAALAQVPVQEAFMPAISPSNVQAWQSNRHYASDEEFLFAIADAMHEEYQAIVDAGLLLQIDDPRMSSTYAMRRDLDIAQCRRLAEQDVEAVNHALRGIPPEKVRFHTCYSINMGPRVHDLELKHIVDLLLKINAGAYSFEAANPRHEHEWNLWKEVKLPAGKVLIPGVITHTSVLVEHPELVAERIVRLAQIVGRENVIAGSDCGFGTFASAEPEIHPTIAWAKLQAMVEGARLATRQLWGRA